MGDFGGGFNFFDTTLAFFGSLINSLVNFVVQVFGFVFRVLGFQFEYDLFQQDWLGKIARGFVKGLKHVLSDIIHLRFVHLWLDFLRMLKSLHDWYEKHFKWLIDLRRRFDRWFNTTIRPILNFLQRVRGVLAIFRIFHLKFAEKLDNLIGGLEAKIIRNTLAIRGKLNEISTIINLVFDPALVIRQNVLVLSMIRALDRLRALLGLGRARPLTGAERKAIEHDHTRYLAGSVDLHLAQLVESGLTAEDQVEQQRARAALEEATGMKLA